jgi:CHASE2 domain-containing sensor protein
VIEYLNAAQHGKRSARKTRLPVQKKTSITTKTLSLSGAAFLLSAALFFSGILDNFELKAFDAFSRKLNPQKPGDKVIILKVDQQSLDALAGQGVTWPWPRQVYAPILTYMSKADAVIMDILYSPTANGSSPKRTWSSSAPCRCPRLPRRFLSGAPSCPSRPSGPPSKALAT